MKLSVTAGHPHGSFLTHEDICILRNETDKILKFRYKYSNMDSKPSSCWKKESAKLIFGWIGFGADTLYSILKLKNLISSTPNRNLKHLRPISRVNNNSVGNI